MLRSRDHYKLGGETHLPLALTCVYSTPCDACAAHVVRAHVRSRSNYLRPCDVRRSRNLASETLPVTLLVSSISRRSDLRRGCGYVSCFNALASPCDQVFINIAQSLLVTVDAIPAINS